MTQTPPRDAGTSVAPTSELAAELAPFWSAAKACAELRLDRAELARAVERHAVLGLKTSNDVVVFPVAQFENTDDRVRVRLSIAAMLPELRYGDGWSVAQLLKVPADKLGSRSPYDAERECVTTGELVEYARLVGREWRNWTQIAPTPAGTTEPNIDTLRSGRPGHANALYA